MYAGLLVFKGTDYFCDCCTDGYNESLMATLLQLSKQVVLYISHQTYNNTAVINIHGLLYL